MTRGPDEATGVSGSSRQPGISRRLPSALHMVLLAAVVALTAVMLAVPYLGLASLAVAFVAICVVMLLVILGWAEKGATTRATGADAHSGQDGDSKRPAL